MHTLEHEIVVASTPSRIYEALTTQNGLQAWHTRDARGLGPDGGQWTLGEHGGAAFVWAVTEMAPDNVVAWECISGPGTSPGTKVHYVLDLTDDGRTRVTLIHSGWESQDGNYKKCNTLWGGLLTHLKNYVETGTPDPMFD